MNADVVLPLERMTVAEKMDIIDLIMADLSRDSSTVPTIDGTANCSESGPKIFKMGPMS